MIDVVLPLLRLAALLVTWLGVNNFDWKQGNPNKKISEGWWLEDNSDDLKWRFEVSNKYEAYNI